MQVLREIDYEGLKLYTCPNGCDESELETGTEGESFMAIMGKPHKYLRCGKCQFGEDNREHPKVEMADVIAIWNATCELAISDERELAPADDEWFSGDELLVDYAWDVTSLLVLSATFWGGVGYLIWRLVA